jgi:hypothetical protein
MEAFAPIKVVEIVAEEVTQPRNDGTRGSALYAVALRLSQRPSELWAKLFEHTWDRPPSYTSRHRPGIARVVGDKIILDGTTLEEVEEVHRETLKGVLNDVNARFAELEQREKQQQDERARREQEHADHVRDAARRIRFEE